MAAHDVTELFGSLGFSVFSIAGLIFFALILSSYVKIITVLGILRAGFGVHSLPASFVTAGLALGLSFFVMLPTIEQSLLKMDESRNAASSYSDSGRAKALGASVGPWKEFLERHAHPEQRERFAQVAMELRAVVVSDVNAPEEETSPLVEGAAEARGTVAASTLVAPTDAVSDKAELTTSWQVLVPAFLVSELQEAFATGLSLFLPFLILDLCIAATLAAVGVHNLDAHLVSLPFKLLLFVMVDGWALIASNLVSTYGG